MTSRVTPGWSWTMEMRFRASRLKRRLLPTLGRPTMATVRFMMMQHSSTRHTLHEPFDAIARFDQLLIARREAGAHVAAAVFAECHARHDGDFFFFEQRDRKRFLVEARLRDARERVETSARRMARQADFVEAPHDEIAAAVILVAHLEHAVPTVL